MALILTALMSLLMAARETTSGFVFSVAHLLDRLLAWLVMPIRSGISMSLRQPLVATQILTRHRASLIITRLADAPSFFVQRWLAALITILVGGPCRHRPILLRRMARLRNMWRLPGLLTARLPGVLVIRLAVGIRIVTLPTGHRFKITGRRLALRGGTLQRCLDSGTNTLFGLASFCPIIAGPVEPGIPVAENRAIGLC